MVKQLSHSVSNGAPAGREHNIVAEYRQQLYNIDATRTHLNVVLADELLEDFYKGTFGEALDAYNAKLMADGRTRDLVPNYLEKIRASKQEKPAYECVIQIGSRDTNPATDEACRAVSEAIYSDFFAWWKERFPNFQVHQAAIHFDEATPHLHMAYVPVSTGNKRGLETKNSLRGAMKAMGFTDIRDVNRAMFEGLEECAKRHGVERLDMGVHRKRLDLVTYKQWAQDVEAETYADEYHNDPRLVALVAEQKNLIDEQQEIIDEQRKAIDAVSEAPTDFLHHRQLVGAADEARKASNRLFPRYDALRRAVRLVEDCIAAVPQLWRHHILNPVMDALRASVKGEPDGQPMRPYGSEMMATESQEARQAAAHVGRARTPESRAEKRVL